jgi:hypothetical protein
MLLSRSASSSALSKAASVAGSVARSTANLPPVLRATHAAAPAVAAVVPKKYVGKMLQRCTTSHSEDAKAVRQTLQTRLAELDRRLDREQVQSERERDDLEVEAFNAARAYGAQRGTLGDFIVPLAHKAAIVGIAGTGMAFGLGRSSGMAAAEVGQDAWLGNLTNLGWSATQPPHPSSVSDHFKEMSRGGVKIALQWGAGAAIGGLGNMAGETMMKPFVNAFFKRVHAPMHPDAAVPGPTCRWMNEQEPGAGDALRAEFKRKAFDVTANVGDKTNIRYGRAAFMAAASIRAFIQGDKKLGFAGNLGTGTAGSTGAGLAIGMAMAIRSAHVTIAVPTPEAVRAAEASGATLAQVMANPANTVEIPVAYTKHLPKPICKAVKAVTTRSSELETGRWETVKDAVKAVGAPVTAVVKSLQETPIRDPARNPLHTVSNILGTWGQRSILMARSTGPGAMMRSVAIPCARLAEGEDHTKSGRLIRASASAFDLYFVIKPWFVSLAEKIVGGDAKVKEAREGYLADTRTRVVDVSNVEDDLLESGSDLTENQPPYAEYVPDNFGRSATSVDSNSTSQVQGSDSTLPQLYSGYNTEDSSSQDSDEIQPAPRSSSSVNGHPPSPRLSRSGSHASDEGNV